MDGGKGTGNRYYIHFEICYSKSGGDRFLAAEKRAAKEIAALLKERGWGIDRVKKHQDFSGKYCPHRTLDMGYQRIIDMIKSELGTLNGTPAQLPSGNTSVPQGAFYRVVAGSYSERANAENAQVALKAKGYESFLDAVTAKDGKSYLRVIVGSFKEKALAEERMNKLIADGFNAFIAIYKSTANDSPSAPTTVTTPVTSATPVIVVGSKVNITATHYSTGQTIPAEQKGSKVHTVMQITGDKVLLKEIYSWVPLSGVKLAGTTSSATPAKIVVGSKVKITGAKYATGQTIPAEQKGNKVHTVMQITGDRALLKEIYSWVYIKDIYAV